MKVASAADHRGRPAKEKIGAFLTEHGWMPTRWER